ncbi:MAG TPA: DUF992 domain-containing protein [Candidatus Sulfotelmatobacter sp.]|nr:DUF992 domain-containing protein [Candidatus Sulfotelmatobacter sp.]
MKRFIPAIVAAAAFCAVPAMADAPGVKVGVLSCNVDSGWGFVFGSSRDLKCTYTPTGGKPEHYAGNVSKFGVDIGYSGGNVIVWAVFSPTTNLAPGALSGEYAGATGGAAVVGGVGANVLVGGSNKSLSLQPVSIEGYSGLNVAGGIAVISLQPKD